MKPALQGELPPRLQQILSRRFTVAAVTENHEEELLRFLHRAYADQPVAAFRDLDSLSRHWQWSREGSSGLEGNRPDGWVAFKDGKMVGHFGILPALASVRGKEVSVFWGRQLIVAPEARGGGAAPLLILTALRESGRPFLIAGLNPQSYSLFRRMGFSDFGRVPLYIRIYQTDRFFQAANAVPRWLRPVGGLWARLQRKAPRQPHPKEGGLSVKVLERFDESFDRWWRRLEPSFPCAIRRTSETMAWRYERHPLHRYTALAAMDRDGWRGLAVVRHGRSRGLPTCFITELLARPDDRAALSVLLVEAERFLLRSAPEPPVFLRCTLSFPALQRALRRSGFLRVPSPIHWMAAHSPSGAEEDFLRPAAWMVNAGDSDLDAV